MLLPIQPDKAVLYSMQNLSGNEDFEAVRRFLLDNLNGLRVANDTASGTSLCWNHGAIHVLRALLGLFDNAPAMLRERAKDNEPAETSPYP